MWGVGFGRELLRSTKAHAEVRTGVGYGVWGFIDFQVVNYLIFREKVPEFFPRSLPYLLLFDGQKV